MLGYKYALENCLKTYTYIAYIRYIIYCHCHCVKLLLLLYSEFHLTTIQFYIQNLYVYSLDTKKNTLKLICIINLIIKLLFNILIYIIILFL